MRHAVEKVREAGNSQVFLRRDANFGYNNLVVDMRWLPSCANSRPWYSTRRIRCNCLLHKSEGSGPAVSGGQPEFIPLLSRAAVAANDLILGPRFVASGREICSVGGLMDWNPDFRKIGMEGLVLLINGADEARAAVRKLVKDGVEWVKTYPRATQPAPRTNDHHTLCMTFEEMHAVVATAHNHGLKVTGHCRANQGIKNALAGRLRCPGARHLHGR